MAPSNHTRSVERLVHAEPAKIFALLADPQKHAHIDGSGMVQGKPQGPERLTLGSRFTMGMKQGPVPYRSVSEVSEFEPDRRVAWRSYGEIAGKVRIGGQTWRWELEPRPEGTLVRHTYDYGTSNVPARAGELLGLPDRMAGGMSDSLGRLAALVE